MNNFFTLGFTLAASWVKDFQQGDYLVVLTDRKFDKVIQQYQFFHINFYGHWSSHYKKLAPELLKVVKTSFTSCKLVSIAKIDATVETKFAERFNLEDFSTLNFFMNE